MAHGLTTLLQGTVVDYIQNYRKRFTKLASLSTVNDSWIHCYCKLGGEVRSLMGVPNQFLVLHRELHPFIVQLLYPHVVDDCRFFALILGLYMGVFPSLRHWLHSLALSFLFLASWLTSIAKSLQKFLLQAKLYVAQKFHSYENSPCC